MSETPSKGQPVDEILPLPQLFLFLLSLLLLLISNTTSTMVAAT